jgi:hypothetical protein
VFKSKCSYILLIVVPLAVELTGIEPITTVSIQADVNGCQQPVGWFDGLDPQWNTTQCALDKVKIYCKK